MPNSTDSKEVIYPMTLSWYEEVKSVTYGELPEFEEPYDWRRDCVEDLYHEFRATGQPHQQALSDVIAALPCLFMGAERQVVFNQESRPQA